MKKYVLIFLFVLATAFVFGQKKASKVRLVNSESSERYIAPDGRSIIKVHKGIFQQDYSTLTSDSAFFYNEQNMVDAFGHVVINQGDTLHIYSDKLNYNGNTKVAVLTNNVKMVDKDATLTTNYFTYNTATRIGIYTGGGKLVNKDNTLTSKNGYYFAFTRDEYFRYDVVCNTSDAIIKSDTLRYNSGNRITYFYGPTNIYGKQDKDVLYTENGTYNTVNEQAFFGKNNLYTQATKTLKGDSLFYDRLKGYGRAIKHVTFNDSEQKATIKGGLGEYYKADELFVMTRDPYMIFVTEDTTAVKPGDKPAVDSVLKNTKLRGKDSLINKTQQTVKKAAAGQKLTLQAVTDSVTKRVQANKNNIPADKKLTLKGITDSVMKKGPPQLNTKNPAQKQVLEKAAEKVVGLTDTGKTRKNTKNDSLYFGADTLKTQMMTFKALKDLQAAKYQQDHRDTSIKIKPVVKSIVYTKKNLPKFITLDPPNRWPENPMYVQKYVFGKSEPSKPKAPAPVKPAAPKVVKAAPKKTPADSIRDKRRVDSIALHAPKVLSDTSRIRVVFGYHHAKLFKSDLQAKADSMFYSTSDSTIRCYVNPIIWTQASQLSGDTINLQMKNKKLDNLDMFPAAFIVNVDKYDSVYFNQVGGKKMHGTFKNGKLNTMLVTGNAETIYFNRDTVKHKVTELMRTLSGKINALFKNGQAYIVNFYDKYDSRGVPIAKTKDEDRILKGFIWKPKERPASKEAVISPYHAPDTVKAGARKAGASPPKKASAPSIKTPDKTVKGTVIKPPAIKTGVDSSLKPAAVKTGKDSTIKPSAPKTGKDSTVKSPIITTKKDSVAKDTTGKKIIIKKP
ncbi:MAG TPA: OstA-like protein [Mucilaginibacter sp.]|nr:OstA-like protein [Mucilaginibacter sp.]